MTTLTPPTHDARPPAFIAAADRMAAADAALGTARDAYAAAYAALLRDRDAHYKVARHAEAAALAAADALDAARDAWADAYETWRDARHPDATPVPSVRQLWADAARAGLGPLA